MQTVFGVLSYGSLFVSLLLQVRTYSSSLVVFLKPKLLKLLCVNNEDNFLCEIGDLGTVGWRGKTSVTVFCQLGTAETGPGGNLHACGLFVSLWVLLSRLVSSGAMVVISLTLVRRSMASYLVWRSSTLYSTVARGRSGTQIRSIFVHTADGEKHPLS